MPPIEDAAQAIALWRFDSPVGEVGIQFGS